MNNRGQAKHLKAVKRAKKLRRKRAQAPKGNEFPRFKYLANDADPAFVELVRAAVNQADLSDPTQLDEWNQEIYRAIASHGSAYAGMLIKATQQAAGQSADLVWMHYSTALGELVLSKIDQEQLLGHIPFNDVLFLPNGREVVAYFRSLQREKGQGGTLYFSSHRPKAVVGGRELTVAFSRHAIQRTCERAVFAWQRYIGLGDAFALFEQCLEFEVCTLPSGELAFTFWENCPAGFLRGELPRFLLGPGHVAGRPYRARIGYCPAVVEGDFLKAKTLLFPGYQGTPEHEAVLRSSLSRSEKAALFNDCWDLSLHRLTDPKGFEVVRRLHQLGVPQVEEKAARYAPEVVGLGPPGLKEINLTPGQAAALAEFGRRHAPRVVEAAAAAGIISNIPATDARPEPRQEGLPAGGQRSGKVYRVGGADQVWKYWLHHQFGWRRTRLLWGNGRP